MAITRQAENNCGVFGQAAGALLLAGVLLAGGCESSSVPAGNADVELVFSGQYTGRDIVPNRSVPTNTVEETIITSLAIGIAGSSVSVVDNNNSSYGGTIGELLFDPSSLGTIQAGEVIAHAQVNFSGYDTGAEKLAEFTGTLRAVALRAIPGRTENAPDADSRPRHVFTLSAENTRYELAGTWREHGGGQSSAAAAAAGRDGRIIIHSSVKPRTNTVDTAKE